MSRGLGKLQRDIKQILDRTTGLLGRPLQFAELRAVFIIQEGADPSTDKLSPTRERSIKRALKGLVDRGDVLIFSGTGGQRNPYRYVTVEWTAAATGQEVRDTAHAKQIVAELEVAAKAAFGARPG